MRRTPLRPCGTAAFGMRLKSLPQIRFTGRKSFIISGLLDDKELAKKPELMADFPKNKLDDWAALAQQECRDKPLDDLTVDTAEGIPVKPL